MKGIAFIITACFVWALDGIIRYPLLGQGVSPLKIVFYEHLILALVSSYVVYKRWRRFWETKVSEIVYFFIVGGLGSGLATLFFTKAFTYLNPSLVILLQKLQPIVAIVLANYVLGEPIHKKFVGWALLCFAGGLLISFEDVIKNVGNNYEMSYFFTSSAFQGYFYTFLAVLGWGSATVFGKKLILSGHDEKEVMCGRFIMGLVVLTPLFFTYEEHYGTSPVVYSKIILMAFLAGLVGMYLYYRGLKTLPARVCTLLEMFFPFWAVLLNWIILGAELSILQIIGAGVLLLGSTVIKLKHY